MSRPPACAAGLPGIRVSHNPRGVGAFELDDGHPLWRPASFNGFRRRAFGQELSAILHGGVPPGIWNGGTGPDRVPRRLKPYKQAYYSSASAEPSGGLGDCLHE